MFRTKFLRSLNNIIFSFIEFIIAIRVLLKFLGANETASFVRWIYETSEPLLAPFEGMFPSPTVSRGFEIEISALFAVIAYAFLAYFLDELIDTFSKSDTK